MATAKKLKFFKILLDEESLLYFPGSFLTGKVTLEIEDDLSIIGLFFHIVGEGVVRLVGGGGILTADKENYIDFRMKLLGDNFTRIGKQLWFNLKITFHRSKTEAESTLNLSNASSKLLLLSGGVHTFPFRLGLPMGLPSTFLGNHGWVQYFCRAELREPNGLVHKHQQVFIVMNPIDLNLEPTLLSVSCYLFHNKSNTIFISTTATFS